MRSKAKWLTIGLAGLLVVNVAYAALRPEARESRSVALSATLDAIDSRQVSHATISSRRVVVVRTDGTRFSSAFPDTYIDDLIALLHQRRVPFEFDSDRSGWLTLFVLLPFLLFGLFWRWLARRLPRPS